MFFHPDSLCAKLIKEKYYPQGHILDTVFPHASSVTWQGISHGLELLKKGVIWRVCDGSSINIWRDNWIPRRHGLKISARRHNTRLKLVSDLFMSGRKCWDENLIKYLFYPHDAEEILKIRIQASRDGDFVAWHHEKNGIFSVKSAYNFALNLKDSQDPVGQSSGEPEGEEGFGR